MNKLLPVLLLVGWVFPLGATELRCPRAEDIREVGDIFHVPGTPWIGIPGGDSNGEVIRFASAEIIESGRSLRACTYVLAKGLLDLRYEVRPAVEVIPTGPYWRSGQGAFGVAVSVCDDKEPARCTFGAVQR